MKTYPPTPFPWKGVTTVQPLLGFLGYACASLGRPGVGAT
jgi:hypothetical protein